jgi:sulfide:quinone oxidoreductase
MDIKPLSADLSVTSQIRVEDMRAIADAGFLGIICNRPDGEGADQPLFAALVRAAAACGLFVRYLPAEPDRVTDEHGVAFGVLMAQLPKPVLAFCRTGVRSATLWALSQASNQDLSQIVDSASRAGFDLNGEVRRIVNGGKTPVEVAEASHAVVIVGAGAAGISVASSLLARNPGLDIAIIDPADIHYYQPGWTLVGAGVFDAVSTARTMGSVLPRGVHWIKSGVAAFEPERNAVILEGCRVVTYQQLVVCPGLKLDWHGVEGLVDTLGRNGVTSNYRYDLASYTWELVQGLRGGKAIFTQPPMPIKCAGAPQKAMYLSADYWRRQGVLKNIEIEFCNAGAVLFGVAAYVPALMEYVTAYGVELNFGECLVAVDGPARKATFAKRSAAGEQTLVVRDFDMLHAVPPQKAPDFIRISPLADAAGWVDVDPASLRSNKYPNVFALGDAASTPNAKTAAAARKQAPVVAHNLLVTRAASGKDAVYDGYGSCPLTVERGKIVLAEFTYDGKLAPSFPKWLIDGTRPSMLAWLLKARVLPPLYWQGMLKGREWLAGPKRMK